MSRKNENVSKIELISPYNLKPYEKNPRVHTDKNIDVICELIEMHGFTQPIEIDQHNRIIAGHGRTLAAIKLNKMNVPVIRTEVEDDQDYIRRVVSDNKVSELSKWSNKQLKECMELLGDIQSLEVPGFTDQEIDKIFGHKHNDVSESSEESEGDFGGGVKVTSESDDRALVKRKTFMFTQKEYSYVTDKLKAIKKEHGLDTEAEAFIKALEPYKGLPKVQKRSGHVTDVTNQHEE